MAWSKAINFIYVCAFILSGGCSAAKEIAASADHAATLAHSVYTRAQWITTHSAEPDTIKAATAIQADAVAILAFANRLPLRLQCGVVRRNKRSDGVRHVHEF